MAASTSFLRSHARPSRLGPKTLLDMGPTESELCNVLDGIPSGFQLGHPELELPLMSAECSRYNQRGHIEHLCEYRALI